MTKKKGKGREKKKKTGSLILDDLMLGCADKLIDQNFLDAIQHLSSTWKKIVHLIKQYKFRTQLPSLKTVYFFSLFVIWNLFDCTEFIGWS